MIEINLIPDVKRELLRAQAARTAVISGSIFVSIIAGGIVIALVLYVFGVQTVRSNIAEDEIEKQYASLSKVEDLSKVLTIQNQLDTMSSLNENKKIDSRLFNVLAAVVPPEPNSVKISQVNVDAEDAKITIDGQTRAFDSMEIFKKTLDSAIVIYTDEEGQQQEAKLASALNFGGVSYGENAEGEKVILFSIDFEYPDELFSPKVKDVTIKLSINGNVTDSYLGIPRSIYAERARGAE